MRTITAALLGAAATLPSPAHATPTTTIADPSDASVPVPVVTAPSALDGYQPYRAADGPGWQQLNQAVTPRLAKRGMMHAPAPSEPMAGGHERPSMHEEAPK
ncbi:hypothetical protein CIW54_02840 [Paraburkholderia sp. T12-10]|nr:hypothetical protein CIW54_02840 [Paraburkholderia sp. T12-10]